MAIHLDHTIVSARDRDASAKMLAHLLGVQHGPASAGPFYAVYVNDGLTLDFVQDNDEFPVAHFCFRVDEETFDQILERIKAAGIEFRSSVRGPVDNKINDYMGGRGFYWNEPEGHQWEVLTVSYARKTDQ